MPRIIDWPGGGGGGGSPLPAPVLSIADDATVPTGAVATVSGSRAGTTNTISYQVVNGLFAPNSTWTPCGSRTGDGTVAVTLPAGIYWFRCVSATASQTTVSNLVFAGLTDGLAAVHERSIQAIEAGLAEIVEAGLLPGIALVTRIYDQVELNLVRMDLPGIAVCVSLPGQTSREEMLGGTNARDDVAYPIYVILMDRVGGDYTPARPGFLLWRQVVRRAFINVPLLPVPEVYVVKVTPGPILEFKQRDYNRCGSTNLFRAISREIRGG